MAAVLERIGRGSGGGAGLFSDRVSRTRQKNPPFPPSNEERAGVRSRTKPRMNADAIQRRHHTRQPEERPVPWIACSERCNPHAASSPRRLQANGFEPRFHLLEMEVERA